MRVKILISSLFVLFTLSIFPNTTNANTFKGDKYLETMSLEYNPDDYLKCTYGTEKVEINNLIAAHCDNVYDVIKECCDKRKREGRILRCSTYFNKDYNEPGLVAAFYNCPKLVRYFVEEMDFRLNLPTPRLDYMPLMFSSAQGHKKTVEEMVALKADVTKLSPEYMKDAQFFAGYYKKTEVYNYLGEVKKKLGLTSQQINDKYQKAANELFQTFKAPKNMAEGIAQIEIMPMYNEIQRMIKDGNKI